MSLLIVFCAKGAQGGKRSRGTNYVEIVPSSNPESHQVICSRSMFTVLRVKKALCLERFTLMDHEVERVCLRATMRRLCPAETQSHLVSVHCSQCWKSVVFGTFHVNGSRSGKSSRATSRILFPVLTQSLTEFLLCVHSASCWKSDVIETFHVEGSQGAKSSRSTTWRLCPVPTQSLTEFLFYLNRAFVVKECCV